MMSRSSGTRCSASSRQSAGARKEAASCSSVILLTAALLAVPIATTLATTTAMAQPPGWAKGHILVQPAAGLSDEALAQILAKRGARSLSSNQRINLHIVAVPPQAEWAVAKALAKNPLIAFAEPDMLVEPAEIAADDPQYTYQWHLPKIEAPTAWATSTGNGITVAILDTGVDPDHPDLVNRLVPGWNSVSLNDDTTPVNSHGTMVAGVIAAETNNAIGVASVAYNAQLMPIRVTDAGSAYDSDIARGLTWAADHGAQIANISYDVTGSSAVSAAAQYMRSKGGVVVVPAGNSGGNPGYGNDPYMISVSATTSSDTKVSSSSYGDYIDVSAPGDSIRTTSDGGIYRTVSGTSFSSATAAGVVALIMATNGALLPSEVESILESTADDLGSVGWDPSFGFGRINAAAAVLAAANVTPTDSQAPAAAITTPAGGSTVAGWVVVAVSAVDDVGVSRVELYADNTLVATDLTDPFEFSWDSTQSDDGAVTLTARAFDEAGNVADAAPVTVTVDNTPPNVALLSPRDGATVRGRVPLSAHASDDVGVAWLTIYVDGQAMCEGNGGAVSCDWKPLNLMGNHTISAKAADGAGNVSSAILSVTLRGNADDHVTNAVAVSKTNE